LEIATNYPNNILIAAKKNPSGDNWTSLMYLTGGGDIHKLMLSFNDFIFTSEEAAINAMDEVARKAIEYLDSEEINKNNVV